MDGGNAAMPPRPPFFDGDSHSGASQVSSEDEERLLIEMDNRAAEALLAERANDAGPRPGAPAAPPAAPRLGNRYTEAALLGDVNVADEEDRSTASGRTHSSGATHRSGRNRGYYRMKRPNPETWGKAATLAGRGEDFAARQQLTTAFQAWQDHGIVHCDDDMYIDGFQDIHGEMQAHVAASGERLPNWKRSQIRKDMLVDAPSSITMVVKTTREAYRNCLLAAASIIRYKTDEDGVRRTYTDPEQVRNTATLALVTFRGVELQEKLMKRR